MLNYGDGLAKRKSAVLLIIIIIIAFLFASWWYHTSLVVLPSSHLEALKNYLPKMDGDERMTVQKIKETYLVTFIIQDSRDWQMSHSYEISPDLSIRESGYSAKSSTTLPLILALTLGATLLVYSVAKFRRII
ncbi:MAG: hypothetical protein Q8N36_05865 [bacterium]|nr:hypothetical protein [bacterium]